MSKTSDHENVSTPEDRSKLAPRQGAYWHKFDKGSYLGYYKADEVRVWTARLDRGRKQLEERLAFADDIEEADGVRVMDFEQARAAARNWCVTQVTEEARQPIDDRPYMTAGPACNRD